MARGKFVTVNAPRRHPRDTDEMYRLRCAAVTLKVDAGNHPDGIVLAGTTAAGLAADIQAVLNMILNTVQ